jgi:3-phosphoshikimate 1-carboxyvinyltransferase
LDIELYIPRPSFLNATIELPHSKSILNRFLMMHAYQKKPFEFNVHKESSDVKILFNALYGTDEQIDFKDAGTPLRFFLVYAAVNGVKSVVTGSSRLKERPIRDLLIALESLGANFEFLKQPYQLPLKVKQSLDLTKSEVSLKADVSSQFVSALLLASPFFKNGLQIHIESQSVSLPYINMTMAAMKQAGAKIQYVDSKYKCEQGDYHQLSSVLLEKDWSSAAFILGISTCMEHVNLEINGLSLKSTQGDAAVVQFFEKFGIDFIEVPSGIQVLRDKIILPFSMELDFTNIPDAFPAIASICAYHKIKAVFWGVQNLKHKESNRVEAMKENLYQMGCNLILIGEDCIELEYIQHQKEVFKVHSHNDHRIAMACSLFALKVKTIVDYPECVEKSFPDYWVIFNKLFK